MATTKKRATRANRTPFPPVQQPYIEPARLYTAEQLCDLIPSHKRGKRLSKSAVCKWVQKGLLKPTVGADGRRRFLGADVLTFLGLDAVPVWHGRTPAQRERDIKAAKERLKDLGIDIK